MIKSIGLLTRKDGLSHEDFVKHWLEVHAPLAHAVPGVRRYVQSHIIEERRRPDIPATDVEIDGIAELWYDDRTAMERANAGSQGTPCRRRLVHRSDQKLHHRREGNHSPGMTMTDEAVHYLSGFGNEHATEALPGTLPAGQNAPQQPPRGLYTEQISGTPFTAPRAESRRSWLYRIRPAAMHPAFRRIDNRLIRGAPFDEVAPPPNRLRWDPPAFPDAPADFIDGLVTMGGNGDASGRIGVGVHIYRATKPMQHRVFYDADGELLIVPQIGRLVLETELGVIEVGPGEIAVIPRGIKFRVALPDGRARGYVCENYGALFRLPELGPIGANGLANARDFRTPAAAFEDSDKPCEVIAKFEGNLWATELDHSPLDVVAWHGNYVPYTYDLARFNTIGTVSFDHPDPSIFTVLTSPSDTPGTANCDFVIFPPRWLVAEHTFRPPWFHRNYMNEFMGLVRGVYDAKAEGFAPGGASLHNCMSAHGPDRATFERAVSAELSPQKIEDTLAFMFETRLVIRPTRFALETEALQPDYDSCWAGFEKLFRG